MKTNWKFRVNKQCLILKRNLLLLQNTDTFDRMIFLFRVQLFIWVFLSFRIQMSTRVCNQWVVTLTKRGHSYKRSISSRREIRWKEMPKLLRNVNVIKFSPKI